MQKKHAKHKKIKKFWKDRLHALNGCLTARVCVYLIWFEIRLTFYTP
jgi:hypothetical protein